jgi:hypothetical protein
MKTTRYLARRTAGSLTLALLMTAAAGSAWGGQSLDIPSKTWGISFGNSKSFTGLRFNFRDSQVQRVNGLNLTLWQPRKDNKDAVIQGLSFGTLPGGGYLRGIQLGILGVSAEKELKGISLGLLGAGCGGDVVGLTAGGLGAGCGGSITGLNLGGLGIGAGKDVTGTTIGGPGAGAGGSMKGVNIGGVGVGAGERLTGLTLGGLAAGAPEVRGITIGGLAVGGNDVKGIQIAGGFIMINEGGRLAGLAASSFNYIRGAQTGLAVGIVNYAYSVKGLQIGLVNIVRDNPRGLKVLPVFNTSF